MIRKAIELYNISHCLSTQPNLDNKSISNIKNKYQSGLTTLQEHS